MNEIQINVDELKDIIKSQELVKLREVQKNFVETKNDLQYIKMKVKTIKYSEELRKMTISYEIEPVELFIDDLGEPMQNQKFISINKLDMISFDDMKRIKKELSKIKPL